jgi:hypothetical protein
MESLLPCMMKWRVEWVSRQSGIKYSKCYHMNTMIYPSKYSKLSI